MVALGKFVEVLDFDNVRAGNVPFLDNVMSLLGLLIARGLRTSKPKQLTTSCAKNILQVYALQKKVPESVEEWKATRFYDYVAKCVACIGTNILPIGNSILDITNLFEDKVISV